jgi:hypothetical protein
MKTRTALPWLALAVVATAFIATEMEPAGLLALATQAAQGAQYIKTLQNPDSLPAVRSYYIDYTIPLQKESYLLYVPNTYDGSEPFGLIVFISSGDAVTGLPPGWENVLSAKRILFLAAQNSGNPRYDNRRLGLAVLGAERIAQDYRIDPKRIYAAGVSGGSRIACDLGFYQSDLIKGVITSVGVNFPGNPPPATNAQNLPYGVIQATPTELADAKNNVRFAIITGPGDFRHGDILRIYNTGFLKEAMQCKLFDVPGMGHTTCDGETLNQAIEYIEGGN